MSQPVGRDVRPVPTEYLLDAKKRHRSLWRFEASVDVRGFVL